MRKGYSLKVHWLGGSGATFSLKILELRPSESRKETKLHEKGHFAQIFERWGHMPPMPPPQFLSMFAGTIGTVAETTSLAIACHVALQKWKYRHKLAVGRS